MPTSFLGVVRNAVKYWYLPLIIGILFIATGIWTFTSPLESYLALSFVFSLSFIFSGFLEAFYAISNRETLENWGWSLAMGIFTLIVGILLFNHPGVTMLTMALYVGFLVLFRSAGAIGLAFDLRNYKDSNWGMLMFIGVLSFIFSIILIWNPALGGMTIVFWTGLMFLGIGIFNVVLAFRLRKAHKGWDKVSNELKTRYENIQKEIDKEIKG